MKLLLFFFLFPLMFCENASAQQTSTSFAAKNPSKLYLGAVLKKANINEREHNILHLIDDDVTMGFEGASVRSRTLKAGLDKMYLTIKDALSSTSSTILKNNISFTYNLQDFKQNGSINNYLGQTVDLEEWFGISQDANSPNTIMMLDIKRTSFVVYLDLPTDGTFKIDPIQLANNKLQDLIYINSLSFGRRVLVLVESNLDKRLVNNTLNNVLEGENISKEDDVVLAHCTFRTVVFGIDDIHLTPLSPFEHILEYIKGEIKTDSYGLPISFGAANLSDNSVFENKY